ncbi:MAG: hypothetical protein K6A23_09305 [Butyrivibrio sp.]|nr:hypothetical protein [Butyrivibrio sp.]
MLSLFSVVISAITTVLVSLLKGFFQIVTFFLDVFWKFIRLFISILPVTGCLFTVFFAINVFAIITGSDPLPPSFFYHADIHNMKEITNALTIWWHSIYMESSSAAIVYVFLAITVILFIPVLCCLIAFFTFSFSLYYLGLSLLVDLVWFALCLVFMHESPLTQITGRFYRLFPAAGTRHYEKSYEKWLRRHHEDFEEDDFEEDYEKRSRHRKSYDEDDFYEEDDYSDDEYDETRDDFYDDDEYEDERIDLHKNKYNEDNSDYDDEDDDDYEHRNNRNNLRHKNKKVSFFRKHHRNNASYENDYDEYESKDYYDNSDDYYEEDYDTDDYYENNNNSDDYYNETFKNNYSSKYENDNNYDYKQYENKYDSDKKRSSREQESSAQRTASNISSFDFFAGCSSVESLNKKYKALVKLYHPDNYDGDTAALQEINVQYTAAKKKLS